MNVCASISDSLTAMLVAIVLGFIIFEERGRVPREHRLDVSAARLPIVRKIVVSSDESLAFLVRVMETEEICHDSEISHSKDKQKLEHGICCTDTIREVCGCDIC